MGGTVIFYVLLLWLLSGCSITQDYRRPQVDIEYSCHVDYIEAADLANLAWWECFQDPVLNELIEIALKENKDLILASARVEEFVFRLKGEKSVFYPQLDYWTLTSRDSQSLERRNQALATSKDRVNASYQNYLNVNWELDIWGRIRRSTEAARAELLSQKESRQAVILSLVSQVATAYIDLLNLDKQLEISKKTLALREQWLQLFENKFKGGQVSNLELVQARSAFEQLSVNIPQLELRIALQENTLSVLLGRGPGKIKRGKKLDMLVIPEVPQGIPSDLLEQRPDIRQSEQNLIAANARVGVAKTQYFPSISLSGLFGYASLELSNLMRSAAEIWRSGVAIAGPVFSGGRIKGEIRQAEAVRQQLVNKYLITIQNAFREVDDSLITIQKLKELIVIQDRLVSVLEDYESSSRSRYDGGYSSYLVVQDAQRELYSAEIKYAQIQKDLFAAIVSIYKALGGGWVTEAAQKINTSKLMITQEEQNKM
ncbi:efflux transporter outer membrane subunit [Candidatus Scalindua japonica]|nr:efflux transporter outer membrane subunit [Candidatus Scalindua japonica]